MEGKLCTSQTFTSSLYNGVNGCHPRSVLLVPLTSPLWNYLWMVTTFVQRAVTEVKADEQPKKFFSPVHLPCSCCSGNIMRTHKHTLHCNFSLSLPLCQLVCSFCLLHPPSLICLPPCHCAVFWHWLSVRTIHITISNRDESTRPVTFKSIWLKLCIWCGSCAHGK